VSLILDLNLFTDQNLPLDDNAIWDILEAFGKRKDEAFEACITDKTREMIR
jgi:uncharacterized protein (TIGR04255 family)